MLPADPQHWTLDVTLRNVELNVVTMQSLCFSIKTENGVECFIQNKSEIHCVPKSVTKLMAVTLSNLNRFSNSSTARKRTKLQIKLM